MRMPGREREKISLLTTRIHSGGSSSLATQDDRHDDDHKGVGVGGDGHRGHHEDQHKDGEDVEVVGIVGEDDDARVGIDGDG